MIKYFLALAPEVDNMNSRRSNLSFFVPWLQKSCQWPVDQDFARGSGIIWAHLGSSGLILDDLASAGIIWKDSGKGSGRSLGGLREDPGRALGGASKALAAMRLSKDS